MKKKTYVNFILDKSGSMSTVKDATISGFNEYLQTLKDDTKADYEFSLTLFDTEVTRKPATNIGDAQKLTPKSYEPSGNTALYDAVCRTIKETTVKKGQKTQKVLTVIMTDGEENSSKEYTEVHMKQLIAEKEKEGNWSFVYLGANQDAYAVAQKYGITRGNTVNFHATSTGVGSAMKSMASNTSFFAQSLGANTTNFFSDEDQDNLNTAK